MERAGGGKLQKDAPARFADRMRSERPACTYQESGWRFVEATMSSLLTRSILQLTSHAAEVMQRIQEHALSVLRLACRTSDPEATNAAVRRGSRPILAQSLAVRTPCAVMTIA